MNKTFLTALVLGWMTAPAAWAGTYEWTSGWGQGQSEYSVDDGNSNDLLITCPDYQEDGPISALATINGQSYYSKTDTGFDVIVDGQTYSNPFFTECRVCGDNFRNGFWSALRKANRLQLTAGGQTVNLPTKNIALLKSLDDPENTCRSGW